MDNNRVNSLKNKKIVCLGGGIGTVNLIRGLKDYTAEITVIVSMADDGGSAGRLRRFYSVPPPGDLVSCIEALSNADPLLKQLLKYRFAGNRYGSDSSLPGQKFGNLMLVALSSITNDFPTALFEMQRIFQTSGKILPSTFESLSIWAETSVGEKVYREQNIDLGKFTGTIRKLHLKPTNPHTPEEAITAIAEADIIIAGPGDLYTTILPVLLVPNIIKAVKKSKAKKMYIVNVANKTFETPAYTIEEYVQAITKHCKTKVFNHFMMNNNFLTKIPPKYKKQYEYVSIPDNEKRQQYSIIERDIVDSTFPLYHSSEKLAKAIAEFV